MLLISFIYIYIFQKCELRMHCHWTAPNTPQHKCPVSHALTIIIITTTRPFIIARTKRKKKVTFIVDHEERGKKLPLNAFS